MVNVNSTLVYYYISGRTEIDAATLYADKYAANSKSYPNPAQLLYRTVNFMKKRTAAKKSYPDNLLASIHK